MRTKIYEFLEKCMHEDIQLLEFIRKLEGRRAIYKCGYCKKEKALWIYNVNSGQKSCGCLIYTNKGQFKHGMFGRSEYNIWSHIKKRCNKTNYKDYSRYGGRGIKLCDRWIYFENFYKDMGPRPSKEYSIDRKNNDGDYCPENCRWATKKEQHRNKRTNRLFTYNNQTKCLAEWADIYNIQQGTLRNRIFKSNMTFEEAINKPIRKINKYEND